MTTTIKRFDFTDPSQWIYKGGVMLWETGSDIEGEIAEAIAESIEYYNSNLTGAFGESYGGWYDYHQALELSPADSRFSQRGTCDHCGAAFKYGAIYQHQATHEHAIVGHICACNTLCLSADEALRQRMSKLAKRLRSLAAGNASEAALAPNRRDALAHNHHINADMRRKFRRFGSLSLKQWALAKKIRRESLEREAAQAEEAANATDVIEGKAIVIEGEVVGTKWVSGGHYYAPDVLKLVVRDDRGFKVYGSAASPLVNHDVGRGFRVRFTAQVE